MLRTMTVVAALMTAAITQGQDYNTAPTAAEHRKETERKDLTPEERATKESDRMAEKLSLSDEQKEKWRAASLERQRANEPYREKLRGSTTPAERRELRKKVNENRIRFDSSVNEFLSAEQKKKRESILEARHDRAKERKHRDKKTGQR